MLRHPPGKRRLRFTNLLWLKLDLLRKGAGGAADHKLTNGKWPKAFVERLPRCLRAVPPARVGGSVRTMKRLKKLVKCRY